MIKILILLALFAAAYAGVVPVGYAVPGSVAHVASSQVGGNFAYSVAEGGHVAYAAPALNYAHGYAYHY